MRIILHDHVPGLTLGKTLSKKAGASRKGLFIGSFAPIYAREVGIQDAQATRLIEQNLSSFVHLIDNAEQGRYGELHVQGSPLRYLAFAEYSQKGVDPETLKRLAEIFDIVRTNTEALVYLEGAEFTRTGSNELIPAADMKSFEERLLATYRDHLRDKIRIIGASRE